MHKQEMLRATMTYQRHVENVNSKNQIPFEKNSENISRSKNCTRRLAYWNYYAYL